ncbi:MAG TPA: hypothetical protein PLZ74_11070 [Kiritimatiellia bacterium]|nr:hypothetical protein [Kiritimatiellia bacterium]
MTKLEIWNGALAQLPHDRTVASLTETSTEALRCAQEWEAARVKVLCAHEWGFLRMSVPVCAGVWCGEVGGMLYAYPRPTSALRILGLFDAEGRKVRAEVVNGLLVSPEPTASVRFLYDEADPEVWPSLVQRAVLMELAARLCPVITMNMVNTRVLMERAKMALDDAMLADSSEVEYSGTAGDTYIMARI